MTTKTAVDLIDDEEGRLKKLKADCELRLEILEGLKKEIEEKSPYVYKPKID